MSLFHDNHNPMLWMYTLIATIGKRFGLGERHCDGALALWQTLRNHFQKPNIPSRALWNQILLECMFGNLTPRSKKKSGNSAAQELFPDDSAMSLPKLIAALRYSEVPQAHAWQGLPEAWSLAAVGVRHLHDCHKPQGRFFDEIGERVAPGATIREGCRCSGVYLPGKSGTGVGRGYQTAVVGFRYSGRFAEVVEADQLGDSLSGLDTDHRSYQGPNSSNGVVYAPNGIDTPHGYHGTSVKWQLRGVLGPPKHGSIHQMGGHPRDRTVALQRIGVCAYSNGNSFQGRGPTFVEKKIGNTDYVRQRWLIESSFSIGGERGFYSSEHPTMTLEVG